MKLEAALSREVPNNFRKSLGGVVPVYIVPFFRQEIQRKDELIRKHNERLSQWLKMLQDLQQQQRSTVGPNAPMAASPSSSSTSSAQRFVEN